MAKAENESTVFAMTIQTPCHAGVSMTSLGFLFLQECFHQIYGQSARIIRLKHTSTHLPPPHPPSFEYRLRFHLVAKYSRR